MLTPRIEIMKIEKTHEAYIVSFSLTGGALAHAGTQEVLVKVSPVSTSIERVPAMAIRALRQLLSAWLDQLNS